MFKSLVTKTALIYLILFLAGLSLIGLLMLRYSSKTIISSAQNNLKHQSELVEVKIAEYLTTIEHDINYLSKSPVLLTYLEQPTNENYNYALQELLALIQSKPDFSQLRFISNSQNGNELLRVDRYNNESFIVDSLNLQNKGDTPYYKETIKLDKDSIYFSDIDLNKEFGKISIPYTPTLRVAKSMYLGDSLKGVIVINANLSHLFKSLKSTVNSSYSLRLANADGFYILHEYSDSTFQFEFDNNTKPQLSNEAILALEERTLLTTDKEYRIIKKINYGQKTNILLSFVVADKNKVLSDYYQWRKNSILLMLIIGLLFMISALMILFKQSSSLKLITSRLKNFPKTRVVENLPINRKDEIGELANSLNEMANIVNQQLVSIEDAKNKAVIAEQQKTEFIENMSHEIRNPLQSIMGLSSMLENNNPNPNQYDLLNSLKFNTSNLLGLVNNILDFQSVLKGDVVFNYDWTNLEALIEEIALGNKYAAINKNIKLEINFDSKLNQFQYKLDKLRINQILSNLISNAIRHTPRHGNVIISTKAVSQTPNESTINFAIIDNGTGMGEEELLKIKERYFSNRGVNALTSNFGLGLTIVNELLSNFASHLDIQSKQGEGSIFQFDLVVPKQTNSFEPKAPGKSFVLCPKKVLIVEDDEQIINLYKYIFNNSDTQLDIKTDLNALSEDAVEYDLIISDYRLNKHTLSDRKSKLIKVISEKTSFIIISASPININEFKDLFPQVKHILKPFNNEHLIDVIEEGYVEMRCNLPKLEEIKRDYDYNKDKYRKAIKILINEWSQMKTNLIQAVKDGNLEGFDAVLHKLITTIRRLKLNGLERYLNNVKDDLINNSINTNTVINELKRSMDIYEKWFLDEI